MAGYTNESMGALVDIADLIESTPEIRDGRPCMVGTGISVHRIAIWHNMGISAESIAIQIPQLSLAKVHAALAHYFANQSQIDAEIAADLAEAEDLEREALGSSRMSA